MIKFLFRLGWAVARFVTVTAFVYVFGMPFTDRGRALRYESGARALRPGTRLPGRGVAWYAWPGYQRSIVRLAAVVLVVCGLLWPWWTLSAVATSVATVVAVAGGRRYRRVALSAPRSVAVVVASDTVDATPVAVSRVATVRRNLSQTCRDIAGSMRQVVATDRDKVSR